MSAFSALGADLRHARRSLLRTPGAAASAVFCLAGAIGAATAMFTVVNAVVLRGLPFAYAGRLVAIWGVDPERDAVQRGFSWPDTQDVARAGTSVDSVAAMANAPSGMTLTGDGEPLQVPSRTVSGNFFDTLGVPMALGRALSSADDLAGSPNAAVIADALWRQRYGADPRAIGRAITLDGRPFTIVGVAPRWFAYPPRAQLWVTIAHGEPDYVANRSVGWLEIIARMKPGVAPPAVRADLASAFDRIARTYHPSRGKETISVTPLQHELLGRTRAAMWALFAGVIVLLGVACSNVGGLLLVRGSARARDISLRVALGAGRADIVRYVLAEALLLAACSSAIGAVLAVALVDAAQRYLPMEARSVSAINVDGAVLLFAVALTLVTVVTCALLPALDALAISFHSAFQQGSRSFTIGRRRLRPALAAGQVALSVVLLIATALVGRTFVKLRAVDVGFAADRVLAFDVPLPASRYPTAADAVRFSDRLLPRIQQIAGVTSAASVLLRPLWGVVGMDWPVTIEGQPPVEAARNPLTNLEAVSPQYFRTVGIPMIDGRVFGDGDRDDRPPVAVVSRGFAERFWPGQHALGRRLKFPLPGSRHDKQWFEVVGIVGDAKYRGLRAARLDLYIPAAQSSYPVHQFVVRTELPPSTLAGAIRAEVQRIDRDAPIDDVVVLADAVEEQLTNPRLVAAIFAVFAATAGALTALGLGTLIAWQVRQRTREIGIRVALGATAGDVVRLTMHEGVVIVAVGAVCGTAIAAAATQVLSSLLYEVSPNDPASVVSAVAFAVVVGLVSVFVPAARSATVDPAIALRQE